MKPRAGAVVKGSSDVVYLLLEPAKSVWKFERQGHAEEDCWRCLRLLASDGDGSEGEVVLVREEWLVNHAEELGR